MQHSPKLHKGAGWVLEVFGTGAVAVSLGVTLGWPWGLFAIGVGSMVLGMLVGSDRDWSPPGPIGEDPRGERGGDQRHGFGLPPVEEP